MFEIRIYNRLTSELATTARTSTLDEANALVAAQIPFGLEGIAWNIFYGPRDYPKKGLGYDNEVDYNISLVDSEFTKTVQEEWTETVDGGDDIIHAAITETWVHLLAEFTSTIEDITTEYNEEQDEIAKIAAGKAARAKCQIVLDYIAGYNLGNAFTLEQISTMQSVFADVEAALRASRPTLALNAVNASTPDGVVVTDTLKTKVASLLA